MGIISIGPGKRGFYPGGFPRSSGAKKKEAFIFRCFYQSGIHDSILHLFLELSVPKIRIAM